MVIDPKGENARITHEARRKLGPVHVLDPFGVTGLPSAAYNPLARLAPDSLDLGEDAASLAEALVMDPPGEAGDAHWNEEARALLAGLILFAAVHETEERRTLASLREYLTLPPEQFRALLGLMQDSPGASGLIARAANRFLGKSDREAAGVLSSAQRHTHFLDSPRITASLARSEFSFASLRHERTSVFLVLPPNRLDAYSRWLRLLVSQALAEIARDAETAQGAPAPTGAAQRASPPLREPTLFLLDEFAALGRLEALRDRLSAGGIKRQGAEALQVGDLARVDAKGLAGLDAEFGETLVLAKRDGLRLWGSDEMGTWTMVFERHDGSSCIVASGIGYQDGTDPSVIFRTAGLPG